MVLEKTCASDCCGCWACANACPQNAITMEEDSEGFLYPHVNLQMCDLCNRCEKVCPVIRSSESVSTQEDLQVLAAWNQDEEIRAKSSSGGIFTILAESVLKDGGIVFGAGFDKGFDVVHKMVSDIESLIEIRGSKYLQSHIGDSYSRAKTFLKQERKVLFSGTPCQIAGLRSFLNREYVNLITCDLVCHGVPSSLVFKKYLGEIERKHQAKTESICFRDKCNGWKRYHITTCFRNGTEHSKVIAKDPFMTGFLKNIYLRPSCHRCLFTGIPRIGDITLGDFWGIASKAPELDDDKGVSLLLVNTEKGRRALEQCKSKMFFAQFTLEDAIEGNPCLIKPVSPSPKREQFFVALHTLPFSKVIKKFMTPPSKIERLLIKATRLLRKTSDSFWK